MIVTVHLIVHPIDVEGPVPGLLNDLASAADIIVVRVIVPITDHGIVPEIGKGEADTLAVRLQRMLSRQKVSLQIHRLRLSSLLLRKLLQMSPKAPQRKSLTQWSMNHHRVHPDSKVHCELTEMSTKILK